jgi:AraC-like DNA-binding protein
MSLLDKFVDSLSVDLHRASCRELKQPFMTVDNIQQSSVIMHLHNGNIFLEEDGVNMNPGSFYLIPAGKQVSNRFGTGNHIPIGPDGFRSEEEIGRYLRPVNHHEDLTKVQELYTFLRFDIYLFNAIPLFEVMDLPPLIIPEDTEFAHLVQHIAREFELQKLGRAKLIKNYMEEIVIHLCRYLDSEPKFKPHIDKLEFLSDRRLVDIVTYIQANLEKDLSNKVIANIAYVSEDYVGQFFKSLTRKNLQDYIENQRLEKAMYYLRTEPASIQEISHRVGFKDPAYFSRRFKLKYGYNANSVRNLQSHLV